jgi:hypothetical protein
MSDRLVNFLVDLVNKKARLSAFEANPEQEVSNAGLTEEEQGAVLSREGRQILGALAASGFSIGIVSMKPPPAAPRPPARPRPPVKPPVKPPRKKAPARKRTPSRPTRKKR